MEMGVLPYVEEFAVRLQAEDPFRSSVLAYLRHEMIVALTQDAVAAGCMNYLDQSGSFLERPSFLPSVSLSY